jgi:hypothetical protein
MHEGPGVTRVWVFLCLLLLLPSAACLAEQEGGVLAETIRSAQDVDQLYSHAVAALAADQPGLAREALERVVSARPRFAGAWLDLALATYRSGDIAAALEHLEYLRSQFALPPALAAQVDYWSRLWENPQHAIAPRGWQGEVLFGVGYDSNVNGGLSSSRMLLSIPGGPSLFDVDGAYLPRADRFMLLNITSWGPAQAVGAGRLNPVLLLGAKQLMQEADFSSLDIQPGLVYQQPAAGEGSWQLSLFAQHASLGGNALYNGVYAAAQRAHPWNTCNWTGGVEYETRQHLRVSNLGGEIFSLSGGLGCLLFGDANLSATLKTGYEQAHGDRPGGDNRRTQLHLRYDHPFNATQRLQAYWQIWRINDQEGYSPILENNAIRRVQRQTFGISLRQAVSREWELRLNYDVFQQRANLPLFEQKGVLTMLSLAYLF